MSDPRVDAAVRTIRSESFVAGYFAAVNAILAGRLDPHTTDTAAVETKARFAAADSGAKADAMLGRPA